MLKHIFKKNIKVNGLGIEQQAQIASALLDDPSVSHL